MVRTWCRSTWQVVVFDRSTVLLCDWQLVEIPETLATDKPTALFYLRTTSEEGRLRQVKEIFRAARVAFIYARASVRAADVSTTHCLGL